MEGIKSTSMGWVSRRRRVIDRELRLTTDLGNFMILCRIFSRHVGSYFSTCRNTCLWDEPSLPKCAVTGANSPAVIVIVFMRSLTL